MIPKILSLPAPSSLCRVVDNPSVPSLQHRWSLKHTSYKYRTFKQLRQTDAWSRTRTGFLLRRRRRLIGIDDINVLYRFNSNIRGTQTNHPFGNFFILCRLTAINTKKLSFYKNLVGTSKHLNIKIFRTTNKLQRIFYDTSTNIKTILLVLFLSQP